METKPYPQYKDSGIEWIGKIPKDWTSNKIKDFLEFDIGGTPPTSNEEFFEGNNIWISIADLTKNKNKFITNSKTKISDEAIKKSNVKLIKKGSLLFSFKLSVGETAFAGCDLYTNEAIASFKENKNISLNYLEYLLKVGFENNAFENIYGAKIFNSDLIKIAKIIKPLFDEQKQIANYLDKKTSTIEENITKNKKLIELLKEKRTVLINQAVTKGLNPDTPMKESGIEWIGKIPEHWKINKVKNIFRIYNGSTPKSNEEYWDGKICWITPADYKTEDVYINQSNRTITKEGYDSCGTHLVKKGSIIISNRAPIGTVAIANKKLCTNQGCKSLEKTKHIKTKYYYYLFSVSKTELEKLGKGTTFMELATTDLNNFTIITPLFEEQKEIVEYLDNKNSKINLTIEKIERNIELLQEYKESLIHHVVTGKIDVRGVEV